MSTAAPASDFDMPCTPTVSPADSSEGEPRYASRRTIPREAEARAAYLSFLAERFRKVAILQPSVLGFREGYPVLGEQA